jgi:signal transduction histidine kinase
MYQAHQTSWFVVGFAVCVGLAIAVVILTHFGKLKAPKYVFFVLIGLAFLLMAIMSRVEVSDEESFRRELRTINPGGVSNLVVRARAGNRVISAANEINSLFNQLQNVQAVHAHHSYPVDSVELQFMVDGHEHRYRIAYDSERKDEYWVLETARAGTPGREIGRVQSGQLGPMLEQLVTHKP